MSFGTDLRHAARGLARRPAFTVVAVSTLGAGIAASTTMFAVVHHLFVAPLPFADADRLAYVSRSSEESTIDPALVHAEAWARAASTLEWVEPYEMRSFTVRLEGQPAEVVAGGAMTPTLAARLGVAPILGRDFSPEDAAAGAAPVVLLGESFWRARFGGRRDVLGRTLRIEGLDRTIIGVMPAKLAAHQERDRTGQLWVPFVPDPADPMPLTSILARVRLTATHEQAARQLDEIAAAIELPYPIPGQWRTRVVAPGTLGDRTRRAVLILFGAVGLVLLIACANVSGLLLARGADRRQEVAVRAALGGTGARIMRLLLAESALLAVLASVAGILLASWGVELVQAFRPNDLRALDSMSIQLPVIAFAVVVAAGAALVAGLVPALHARHVDLLAAMRGGAAEHPGGLRLRHALVAGEIALCMVLVLGAVLLMRTLADLQSRELGFNPSGVMTVHLRMPADRYTDTHARQTFAEQLLDRVRSLPGVAGASVGSSSPARPTLGFGNLAIEGSDAPPVPPGAVPMEIADEHYLTTLGIPLRAGRYLIDNDPVPNAVVINESFARLHWTVEQAVGRRIRISERGGWMTIVGVAGDVRSGGPQHEADAVKLYTGMNYSLPFVTLLVRVTPDRKPLTILPALRAVVQQLDPDLPLRDVGTLEQQLRETLARERFTAMLLTTFGLVAMILAVTGLYGLIGYAVARRTREIGIRMALGASGRAVQLMLFRDGARLALAGIVTGGMIAMWSAALLRSLLHGTAPRDPGSLAITALAVGCATCAAVWLPARRATRIDPQTAVRVE